MRLITALIVIVLLAGACAGEPLPTPTATPTPSPAETPAPPTATPTPTATPQPTATPAPPTVTPTPTFAPPSIILPSDPPDLATVTPVPEYPRDLDFALDVIALATSAIRGLSPTKPVERLLVSEDELRAMIEDELAEDADDLELDGKLYQTLGIIEPDVSLSELLLAVYGGIAVGLYDADDETLAVRGDSSRFGPAEELTVVHEITHSLQQMRYDIDGMLDDAEGNSDLQAALTGLIEGDASITETLYEIKSFSERQSQRAEEAYAEVDDSAYRAAPAFIRRVISFPYSSGRNFAIDLYLLNGSYAAIDAAYAAPPQSTEQVLHFELYITEDPAGVPVAVELPDVEAALGEGWSELKRDAMGELFFQALLLGEADYEDAQTAAAGWGGDAYALLEGPSSDHAVASLSVWDTPEDAAEFGDAIRRYLALNDVFYRVAVDEATATVRLAVVRDDADGATEVLDGIVEILGVRSEE